MWKEVFLEEAEATSEVVEAEVAEVEEVVSEAQEADLDLTHIEKTKWRLKLVVEAFPH